MQVQKKHMRKKVHSNIFTFANAIYGCTNIVQIKEKTCKHIFKNNYKRYLFSKFAKKNMEHEGRREIAMSIASISIVYYTWLVDSK